MYPAGDVQKHASQAAQMTEPGANAKSYCKTHGNCTCCRLCSGFGIAGRACFLITGGHKLII